MSEDDRTRLGGSPGGPPGGNPPPGNQGGQGGQSRPGAYGTPPPQGGGYGAPPPPPPQYGGYGAPPQGSGYGAPPPPPAQGGYGAPPPGPPGGYGQPPQQGGYGAPPPGSPGGSGMPPQQGRPQPPPAPGYGAPPGGGYNQPQQYGAPPPAYPGSTPRQLSFDTNALLGSLRLGDLVAVGGALLFFIAKFFAFVRVSVNAGAITTPGVPSSLYSASVNGWDGTRGVWDFFQLIALVAVIAAAVVIGLNLLPQFGAYKGWIYTAAGALLMLLTIIAFFDARSQVGSGLSLSGISIGPQFGFFALIIFGLAVAVGGLMKQGIVPGDDAVSLGGGTAALAHRGPQPFSSNYYGGQQPPQPPQPPQGYGAPPPPAGGYGAPPPPPGPQGYNQPRSGGYDNPPPPQR